MFDPAVYENSVNWEKRLGAELPFLEAAIGRHESPIVLDAGCGVGRHTAALSGKGYDVTGIDSDPAMIAFAKANNGKYADRFTHCPIGNISSRMGVKYTLIFMLGNTLPIAAWNNEEAVFSDLFNSLVPGGAVIFQMLNFNRIKKVKELYLPLRTASSENGVFHHLRSYLYREGRIEMLSSYVYAEGNGYKRSDSLINFSDLSPKMLYALLGKHGFSRVSAHSGYGGEAFDEQVSDNLVCECLRL